MGRHATPPARPPRPDRAAPRGRRLLARLVLAATAFVATTLAVSWAGNPWSTAALVGLAAAVVVLVAAWLAGTMPAPPRTAPRPQDAGDDPVQ
ncbi:MAG: hypothetical protein GX609_11320 [Actinomycetales bacterium]|jgi:hypothetical protein|nr:hypothetical protein [Actinomycetales bacterium]